MSEACAQTHRNRLWSQPDTGASKLGNELAQLIHASQHPSWLHTVSADHRHGLRKPSEGNRQIIARAADTTFHDEGEHGGSEASTSSADRERERERE